MLRGAVLRGAGRGGRGGASRGAPGTGGGPLAAGRDVDAREGSPRASRGERVGLLRLLRMNGIRQEAGVWSWNLGGGGTV